VLFGLGNGAYTSVDWALSIDVLPSLENAGEGLGLWNASMTLPAILAPLLGNLIINITDRYGQVELGYRLIFTVATFFLVVAAMGILFVREQKSTKPDYKKATHIGWKFTFQTRAGKARGFLRAWPLWENLSRSLWRVQPIPHAPHHLLEVRFTHYSGRPLDLPDGTHIQKGDPLIELHFRNRAFLDIAGTGEAWRYMRMIEQNLQALAHWMQEPDFTRNARAIFGATLLSRGAPRLGFTVRERPKNLYTWLDRFFMTGLLVLYNPQGRERLLQGTTYGTYPQEVWMSREELLKRYGNSSSPAKE
jgi:MFS family permease